MGRPLEYCREGHRRAAERDPAPPGYFHGGTPFAHPLSHPAVREAFELLDDPAVKGRALQSSGSPLAHAVLKAIELLQDPPDD